VGGVNGAKVQIGVVAAALANDPREAALAARTAGFSGVEFDALIGGVDLTQLSQTGRREFAQVLRSNDQQLIALRADLGSKGFGTGADIDRLLSRLTKIMEAAKGLSTTPMVCMDLGALPEPAKEEKPRPRVTQEQAGLILIPEISRSAKPQAAEETVRRSPPDPAHVAQVDNATKELCTLADRLGVTLALRSDLASFAALERTLAAAACPWAGVDLDPVGILRDDWTSDEIFSRLGPLIRHVRGRDANVGADKRTRPAVIGRGSTSWHELQTNLDAAGYRGWITIDPIESTNRRAAAAAGLAHLKTSAP
jgi:sugar phosphate isomerase/epimerase